MTCELVLTLKDSALDDGQTRDLRSLAESVETVEYLGGNPAFSIHIRIDKSKVANLEVIVGNFCDIDESSYFNSKNLGAFMRPTMDPSEFSRLSKTPAGVVMLYREGLLSQIEMDGMLLEVLSEENAIEIVELLRTVSLRRQRGFHEYVFGLLEAVEAGEPIFRLKGPPLTPEEIEDDRKRLRAIRTAYQAQRLEISPPWWAD